MAGQSGGRPLVARQSLRPSAVLLETAVPPDRTAKPRRTKKSLHIKLGKIFHLVVKIVKSPNIYWSNGNAILPPPPPSLCLHSIQ